MPAVDLSQVQKGKLYIFLSPDSDVTGNLTSHSDTEYLEINTGTKVSIKVSTYFKKKELNHAQKTNQLIGEFGIDWPQFDHLNSYLARLMGTILSELEKSDRLLIGTAGLSVGNESPQEVSSIDKVFDLIEFMEQHNNYPTPKDYLRAR